MIFVYIIIVLLCILASGFFSGSESGLYFARKDHLSLLAAQGNAKAKGLLEVLKKPSEMISVMLIGNTIVLQMATFAAILVFEYFMFDGAYFPVELATTLVLFFPFFFFGEVFPKATYRMYANQILLLTYPLLVLCKVLLSPVSFIFFKLIQAFESKDVSEEDPAFDRQHLTLNFGHAFAGGVLSEEQLDSMTQAVNVGSSKIEQLMISILRGTMIPLNSRIDEVVKMQRESQKYVFPVYDRKKTEVIGLLNLRDYVLKQRPNLRVTKSDLAPVYTIEKGEPFSHVFKIFFEHKIPIVFVKSKDKIIGYITWEDAVMKLLR